MSSSGSYDFNLTRTQLVSKILRLVRVYEPTDEETNQAIEALQLIIKEIGPRLFPFWTIDSVDKTLTASDEATGDDAEIYTCIFSHTSAATDEPITGANYSSRWRKRGSTGSVWALATPYANIGEFEPGTNVLAITGMYVRRAGTDTPIEVISKAEYDAIDDKYIDGVPAVAYFERVHKSNVITPTVRMWPIPASADYVIHYSAWLQLEDMDAAANNLDFLQSWVRTLAYMTAADLCDEHSLPLGERRRIEGKAEVLFIRQKSTNTEPVGSNMVKGAYR